MQGILSTIEAVTVYRSGARVTRRARVPFPEDATSPIRMVGLPLCLDDSSIRVRVEGINGAPAPIAKDVRLALEVPEVQEDLPPADDAGLDQARRDEAQLASLCQQIERECERLSELTLVERGRNEDGGMPPPSPTAARLALLDYRDRLAQKLTEELAETRAALRRAERIRVELEDRDARASSARRARESEMRKTALVSLAGSSAGGADFDLVVEYNVPGARWSPSYSTRISRDSDRAELVMRASVAQRTGEDWTDVALHLSTADLQAWAELPELPSLRIGRVQPAAQRRGWRPPPVGVDALFADFEAARLRKPGPPPPPWGMGRPPEPESEADFPDETTDEMDTAVLGAMAAMATRVATESDANLDKKKRAAPVMRSPAPQFAAAPAPPPPAASAPMAPGAAEKAAPRRPQAAKRRRAAVRGGLEREELAAEIDTFDYEGGELLETGEHAPAESALVARSDLLDYGNLRMPAITSERRGRLVLLDQTEIYMQVLVQQQVAVMFDAVALVDSSIRAAEAVAQKPAPYADWTAFADDFDYAYSTAVSVTVDSDGEYHSVPVASAAGKVAHGFVTVPRESTDVFRTAVLDNPLESPLLPGPVDIYLDGVFLLTSRVDFTAPGGTAPIGLGVEQAIKVSRNTDFREDAAGLLGGSLTLEHDIAIELQNHLDRDAAIEVRERVPVTRVGEDDIEMEITSVKPEWEPYVPFAERANAERLRGGHVWKISVARGAKQKLAVSYRIKISSKNELVGGNRRET